MKKDDKLLIAQSNLLTLSRYDFKVIEKRCLYFIIKEVRRLYIDSNRGQKDLFDNMFLNIPSSSLRGLADEVSDVYKALRDLKDRKIEIDNDDFWLYTSWVLQVKHDKKTDSYLVDVSRDILPYLVELASNFTSYDFTIAVTLKSIYSQRFYELCCQYRNRSNKTFFLEIEKLREIFYLEDKYPNIAHLRQKVLDVAQTELKELYDKGECDLWFDYRVKETKGRKILSYFFQIHTKEDERSIDYNNAMQVVAGIRDLISPFFLRDKKFVTRVITAVQLNPAIGKDLLDKLRSKINDYSREEIAPIFRFILREDYNIK